MDVAAQTDAQLLDHFIANRADGAFEALVRRHGPMVLGVCRRVLQNEADAADAFQATFLVLVRRADSVVPRELVGHWLYGVASKTALKTRALRNRRRGREQSMAQLPEPAAECTDPTQELRKRLDQELSRLPAKYRVPLILCELQGLSYKDAAYRLGLTVSALSVRLVRGRTMLAGRLARHGAEALLGVVTVLLSQSRAAAEVPGWLTDSTVLAAGQVAAGTAAAGAAASHAASIAEGVLKSMALAKAKSVAIAALVVAVIGLPAGAIIHRAALTDAGTDASNQATVTGSATEADSAAVAGTSLPPECIAALQSNARAFRTANMSFAVEWVGGIPSVRRISAMKAFLQLDSGKFFSRIEYTMGLPDGRTKTTTQEMAFDGATFYTAMPRSGRTPAVLKVRVDDPDNPRRQASGVQSPYLDAAGIFVGGTFSEWKTPTLDSLVLHMIGSGRLVQVSSDGRFWKVNVETPDQEVLRAKGIDLDEHAKRLKSDTLDQASVAEEIETLRRLQSANPVRLVPFRLDQDKGYAVVGREEFTPDGNPIDPMRRFRALRGSAPLGAAPVHDPLVRRPGGPAEVHRRAAPDDDGHTFRTFLQETRRRLLRTSRRRAGLARDSPHHGNRKGCANKTGNDRGPGVCPAATSSGSSGRCPACGNAVGDHHQRGGLRGDRKLHGVSALTSSQLKTVAGCRRLTFGSRLENSALIGARDAVSWHGSGIRLIRIHAPTIRGLTQKGMTHAPKERLEPLPQARRHAHRAHRGDGDHRGPHGSLAAGGRQRPGLVQAA